MLVSGVIQCQDLNLRKFPPSHTPLSNEVNKVITCENHFNGKRFPGVHNRYNSI